MPQITEQEFERVPLRVHTFLADVPLHDVWAVDLPRSRPGVTLDEFLRVTNARLFTLSPAARALLNLRFFIGGLFGWDSTLAPGVSATFADRLTPEDRASSLAPAGREDGLFRIVYQFENEQLSEVINRTAHAAVLTALVETAASYRFYFAVYVREVGPLTPFYMALIDPFRKLIVYPSLLQSVQANWKQTIGGRATG
jgi:Protein of unknown function (DUF2867)